MATSLPTIPVLDLALLSDDTRRPEFIALLRHALINIGFLYLKNHSVSQKVIDRLVEYIPRLFDLPQDVKDKILMANSPHFMGYSRLASEFTNGSTDHREQFDFGTPYEVQQKPGDPDYIKFCGPCQWPDEDLIPGFRETLEDYLLQVQNAGYQLMSLFAEALQLPSNAFAKFYDLPEQMQSRAKERCSSPRRSPWRITMYPGVDDPDMLGNTPHFDAGFVTFVLQLPNPHPGLQVQLDGQWIDATPIPGTFTVNIGKSLEYVTRGLAKATYHRVVLPPAGATPRYSVPLFQGISLNVRLADEVLDFPPEILRLKDLRGDTTETNSTKDNEFYSQPSGNIIFGRGIKSHPDIAERYYPDLFEQYFPNGMPKKVNAY
ncbi:hypothetical protein V8B97DRAFT_2007857 [Scleroderma yunnanense]